MKALKLTLAALLASALLAPAALSEPTPPYRKIEVKDLIFKQIGDSLKVGLLLDPSGADLARGRSLIVTPKLVAEGVEDQVLGSVAVLGRTRYIYYKRNGLAAAIGAENAASAGATYEASAASGLIPMEATLPYSPSLEDASLVLDVREVGCHSCTTSSGEQLLASGPDLELLEVPVFTAEPLWIAPPKTTGEKIGTLSGRAFIEFPSNVTRIIPERGRNRAELGKITGSIDSVRLDPDVTLKSLKITGYASPEGTYSHNADLARGRTEALRDYVASLYSIPGSLLSTDYVPEDWDGLRKALAEGNLEHRDDILDIIDNSGLDPDPMEWRIKSRYPADYSYLLTAVYPSLRHSDYEISYQIRTFTDPAVIRGLARTAPSKLSLEEFFLAAQDCPEGGEEFVSLFETAARMFPDDPVASYNAASAALLSGDLDAAAARLANAAPGPEKDYASALVEALRGNSEKALESLRSIRGLSGENAAKAARAAASLEEMLRIQERNKSITNKLK